MNIARKMYWTNAAVRDDDGTSNLGAMPWRHIVRCARAGQASAIKNNRKIGETMGPLAGVRIIEMAGIGPGPFCGMMLSDMGAAVIRVGRPSAIAPGVEIPRQFNVLNRGRRSIVLDL